MLPRHPNVNELLDEFLASREKALGSTSSSASSSSSSSSEPVDKTILLYREIVAGLKVYFNKAIGSVLLYKFERGQYKKLLERQKEIENSSATTAQKKNNNGSAHTVDMANVYGAEHLLRLFGK